MHARIKKSQTEQRIRRKKITGDGWGEGGAIQAIIPLVE